MRLPSHNLWRFKLNYIIILNTYCIRNRFCWREKVTQFYHELRNFPTSLYTPSYSIKFEWLGLMNHITFSPSIFVLLHRKYSCQKSHKKYQENDVKRNCSFSFVHILLNKKNFVHNFQNFTTTNQCAIF